MSSFLLSALRRAVVLGLLIGSGAWAQERITLVAPFPPGGPVDTLARILAEGLQKRTGQPAVAISPISGAIDRHGPHHDAV